MSSFQTALENLKNSISDLSSVEVATFKGTIELTGDNQPQTLDEVMAAVKAAASVNARVLAYTKMDADGDIVTYMDDEVAENDLAAHNDLVQIAHSNRQETIEMLVNLFGIKL
ncbi:hypothetical protein [Oceanobacter mangrovi]|uniref:hypothetical protein n=1 Tax=Oceanobacter mangrovi TaxID=2862510 RepID=UPI001C8E1848|nr:hypothetical protein [Oceanobacter mangrovi]